MPGLFRLILYILIGYIIYKGYKILLHYLSGSSGSRPEQKVHGTENHKNKINKDDIIEAQFEDIDDEEKPTEK